MSHVFFVEGIVIYHAFSKRFISFPSGFAAWVINLHSGAADSFPDAFGASVVELHAFHPLGEVSMLFSITPHMRVGLPHKITQLGIGKLQTLFNFNLRPIIGISAILQCQLAHRASPECPYNSRRGIWRTFVHH